MTEYAATLRRQNRLLMLSGRFPVEISLSPAVMRDLHREFDDHRPYLAPDPKARPITKFEGIPIKELPNVEGAVIIYDVAPLPEPVEPPPLIWPAVKAVARWIVRGFFMGLGILVAFSLFNGLGWF